MDKNFKDLRAGDNDEPSPTVLYGTLPPCLFIILFVLLCIFCYIKILRKRRGGIIHCGNCIYTLPADDNTSLVEIDDLPNVDRSPPPPDYYTAAHQIRTETNLIQGRPAQHCYTSQPAPAVIERSYYQQAAAPVQATAPLESLPGYQENMESLPSFNTAVQKEAMRHEMTNQRPYLVGNI